MNIKETLDELKHNIGHITDPIPTHGIKEMQDYARWALEDVKKLERAMRPMPGRPSNQCTGGHLVSDHVCPTMSVPLVVAVPILFVTAVWAFAFGWWL